VCVLIYAQPHVTAETQSAAGPTEVELLASAGQASELSFVHRSDAANRFTWRMRNPTDTHDSNSTFQLVRGADDREEVVLSVESGAEDTLRVAVPISAEVLSVGGVPVQLRVSGSCDASSAVQSIHENGTVSCTAVGASVSGYNETAVAATIATAAGEGLVGSIVTDDDAITPRLGVDYSATQARVAGSCATAYAMNGVEEDGTVTCVELQASSSQQAVLEQIQVDLDALTSHVDAAKREAPNVTAGTGLSGTVTSATVVLGADFSTVQARVLGSCGVGNAMSGVHEDGSVVCAELQASASQQGVLEQVRGDTNTLTGRLDAIEAMAPNVTAGAGLSCMESGGMVTLASDFSVSQARVVGVCGAGTAMVAVTKDGDTVCAETNASTAESTTLTGLVSSVAAILTSVETLQGELSLVRAENEVLKDSVVTLNATVYSLNKTLHELVKDNNLLELQAANTTAELENLKRGTDNVAATSYGTAIRGNPVVFDHQRTHTVTFVDGAAPTWTPAELLITVGDVVSWSWAGALESITETDGQFVNLVGVEFARERVHGLSLVLAVAWSLTLPGPSKRSL
jgi:hypothetical protein